MLNKKCENCGKTFYKDYFRSKKDFIERARYCSNSCKVYKQEGFYKHWRGKKRPELKKTQAANTMFKKGRVSVNKGKKCPWAATHGMSSTNLYRRWLAINQRCNNPKTKQFVDYGGRGIKNEWKSFEDFRSDMFDSFKTHLEKHGERQTRIERINNDGNYKKDNCKWATCKEQMRNRRNNHIITFKGKTQCMTDWANEIGISYSALWKRMKKMPIEKALAVGYEV